MKKQLTEKLKEKKGITLIALVITIIILLIIAGVVIATLTGDNGLLNRATRAKDRTAIAEVEERIQLSYNAALATDFADGKANIQKTTLETELEKEFPGSTISVEEDPSDSTKWIVTVDGISVTVKAGVLTASSGDENTVETLAKEGKIKRWDKVNYNPGTGTTASIELPEGATLGGTINAGSASNWVVLDVNETTGEVLIMPRTVSDTTLTLSGIDGYNNAIEAIDKVAGIYKNETYAQSARSLTFEDVNKVLNHNTEGLADGPYSWTHRYGMDPDTLNITDAGEGNTASQTYISTAQTGYEWYEVADTFGRSTNYWLASRRCDVGYSIARFYVCLLWAGGAGSVDGSIAKPGGRLVTIGTKGVFEERSPSFGISPVVTLKSNVQLESTSVFYTETATATATVAEQDETHTFEHNEWKLSLSTN